MLEEKQTMNDNQNVYRSFNMSNKKPDHNQKAMSRGSSTTGTSNKFAFRRVSQKGKATSNVNKKSMSCGRAINWDKTGDRYDNNQLRVTGYGSNENQPDTDLDEEDDESDCSDELSRDAQDNPDYFESSEDEDDKYDIEKVKKTSSYPTANKIKKNKMTRGNSAMLAK